MNDRTCHAGHIGTQHGISRRIAFHSAMKPMSGTLRGPSKLPEAIRCSQPAFGSCTIDVRIAARRRSAKNALSTAPHSSASTPPTSSV
jgi:hypothetical protein